MLLIYWEGEDHAFLRLKEEVQNSQHEISKTPGMHRIQQVRNVVRVFVPQRLLRLGTTDDTQHPRYYHFREINTLLGVRLNFSVREHRKSRPSSQQGYKTMSDYLTLLMRGHKMKRPTIVS